MATQLLAAGDTIPLVGWFVDTANNTLRSVFLSLAVISLAVIIIGLVAAHIKDRESGKWWKAMIVWCVGIALFYGASQLIAWIQSSTSGEF